MSHRHEQDYLLGFSGECWIVPTPPTLRGYAQVRDGDGDTVAFIPITDTLPPGTWVTIDDDGHIVATFTPDDPT